MEKSLFFQYVDKWFGPIVRKIVEKVNDSKNPLTYLHKTMLTREYSPTLKWGSLTSNGNAVAADVVSLNSSLPLKKRDSIQKAEGDIPKLGMKLALDEKTLTELDILEAQNSSGNQTNQIIRKLFADAKKGIVGIDEQKEAMFLQALSTGLTVIADENNTGVGIRIDFKHPDKNKYGVVAPWSGSSASPVDDIERVVDNARDNGDIISVVMMDKKAANNLRKHAQIKELFAAGIGFSGSNIPTPSIKQLNTIMQDNYDITLMIVDRSVKYEKNGKTSVVKPWADNVAVFLTQTNVGKLVWGRLAEMNHPAKQVSYQIVDEHTLVSKYHKIDPLEEFTSVQALVVPVIENVDSIYILNTEEATASEDAQTEGDANYTYQGTAYTKQSVVDGINAAREVDDNVAEAKISNADSTLAKKIDQLSEEGIKLFEAELVEAV